MKRKIWSIITAILLLLVVSGCSPKRVAKTSHTRNETSYYQDLSKMDRNKVNFKFKATEDESTASDTTNYLVDMTIKNTSKTNVKFNLSKFVMLNPYDDSTKVTSNKKNTVTVKPGQSKIINSIFEKVSKDILDGQGAYYYLNKDYKLAYFYKSYNSNGVTSNNLKSGAAKKFNSKKHESVVKDTTDTDNTQNQNNTTSTQIQENTSDSNTITPTTGTVSITVKFDPNGNNNGGLLSFTMTNITDQTMVIDPEMLLIFAPPVIGTLSDTVLNGGNITLKPSQSHSFPQAVTFDEDFDSSVLMISYAHGGNMLYSNADDNN